MGGIKAGGFIKTCQAAKFLHYTTAVRSMLGQIMGKCPELHESRGSNSHASLFFLLK